MRISGYEWQIELEDDDNVTIKCPNGQSIGLSIKADRLVFLAYGDGIFSIPDYSRDGDTVDFVYKEAK